MDDVTGSRLADRRVLVTGAASGIGLATALRLLADGARVAGWDVKQLSTGPSTTLRSWICNVGDESAVADTMAQTVNWLGGLDALVHVAGIIAASDVAVDQLEQSDWDRVISANLTGPYLVVKHAVPHLEQTGGVIVLTGSGAGIFNAHRSVPYAASKGGLHGLTITLEHHLRERGIRVNDVAPGAVDTPLMRRQSSDSLVNERKAAGKIIDASQVAALMAFLVSRDATAVRGTVRTW